MVEKKLYLFYCCMFGVGTSVFTVELLRFVCKETTQVLLTFLFFLLSHKRQVRGRVSFLDTCVDDVIRKIRF